MHADTQGHTLFVTFFVGVFIDYIHNSFNSAHFTCSLSGVTFSNANEKGLQFK